MLNVGQKGTPCGRSLAGFDSILTWVGFRAAESARRCLSHPLPPSCDSISTGITVELSNVTPRDLSMPSRRLALLICAERLMALITRAGGGGNVIQAMAVFVLGRAETIGGCLSLMGGCILGSSEMVTVVIRRLLCFSVGDTRFSSG